MMDNGEAPNGRQSDSIETSAATLSAEENARIWRTERRALRLAAFAATLLAAALALPHLFGDSHGVRYALMLVALAIILAAAIIQLRIRCPRCGARLAMQSALMVPEGCKSCGVRIRHPERLDSELDV